jgi:hypothetical protein
LTMEIISCFIVAPMFLPIICAYSRSASSLPQQYLFSHSPSWQRKSYHVLVARH